MKKPVYVYYRNPLKGPKAREKNSLIVSAFPFLESVPEEILYKIAKRFYILMD